MLGELQRFKPWKKGDGMHLDKIKRTTEVIDKYVHVPWDQ